MFDCGPTGRWFESAFCRSTLTFPPVVHDWVNKGLGTSMSSRVCATGHMKDPVRATYRKEDQYTKMTCNRKKSISTKTTFKRKYFPCVTAGGDFLMIPS